MDAGARWTLPAARRADAVRTLYLFEGGPLRIAGREIGPRTGAVVQPDVALELEAVEPVDVLLLQGRPIGPPVARYGPFVMNTKAEIEQASPDYQAPHSSGCPGPSAAPWHTHADPSAPSPHGNPAEPPS